MKRIDETKFPEIKHWIFDMDGTLTNPIHDFDAIREILNIPNSCDILDWINEHPREISQQLHKKLDSIEYELAGKTEAREGTLEFLSFLKSIGCSLGIVTRNSRKNTAKTLENCGIDHLFDGRSIRCREDLPAKPHPDQILHLIKLWDADPLQTAMVGDYIHDIEAGNSAGVKTVYMANGEPIWDKEASLTVDSWSELKKQLSWRSPL